MVVLDISNHDYTTFSAECFRNSGVERVIVNAWEYQISRDMIQKCRAVGIKAEDIYAFLYFGLPHELREVHNALRLAEELGGIKRIWLDVEARPPHEAEGMNPYRRIAVVTKAVEMVWRGGVQPGIYTGQWYWVPYMANTTIFSKLPLWLSYYGKNDGTQTPIRQTSFGGWTRVAVHQYTSRLWVCGRHRDANYWFIDTENSKEDDMTPAELIEALKNDKRLRDALVAMVVEDTPIHLEIDAKKRRSWVKSLRAALAEAMQEEYPSEAADPVRMLALVWRRMKRAGDILSNPQPPQE